MKRSYYGAPLNREYDIFYDYLYGIENADNSKEARIILQEAIDDEKVSTPYTERLCDFFESRWDKRKHKSNPIEEGLSPLYLEYTKLIRAYMGNAKSLSRVFHRIRKEINLSREQKDNLIFMIDKLQRGF